MPKKIIIASLIGQIIEWYDFIIYGFFAPILAQIFFPHTNKILGLIYIFGTFAAGFLTRPLGAFLFGSLGDKYGRKNVFSTTLILMGIPSILIGLTPTYNTIGIFAPIFLLIMRMIQGFSGGGEFTGSIIFLGEHAQNSHRGLYTSLAWVGSLTGTLIASLVSMLITSYINKNLLYQGGWRAPFIIGGLAVIMGIYLRKSINDSPVFKKNIMQGNIANKPIWEALLHHKKSMLLIMGMNVQLAVLSYMVIVYMPTYLSAILGLDIKIALFINTLSIIALILLAPFFGWIADAIGRKPVLVFSNLMLFFWAYPAYWLITNKNFILIFVGQSILIFLLAAAMGANPSAMIEQVPTRLRFAASSISYNLIICLLGGTTPLISTYLIHKTGNILSPTFYLLVCSIISLIAVLKFQETYRKSL